MPRSQLFVSLFLAVALAPATYARSLTFSFTDPRGDNTGRIDITEMTMTFDDSTGSYEIVLTADAGHPFLGQFQVNINLYNPDALTAGNDRSFFSDTFRSYNLPSPATTLKLTGTHANLPAWKLGHRVATSSPAFGNPPGTTLFRSSVLDLPVQNCPLDMTTGTACAEDTIAWGASATVAEPLPPPSQVTALSAASYVARAAPDSLVSLFGSGLAGRSASATLDSAGQLPVALADVSVEINGLPAGLAYVSPTQINLVAPRQTEIGTARISVKNAGTEVISGTMTVSLTAPAMFSSDGTGKGSAVAYNAVTFAGTPFSVLTPESSGSDKRTRLAILGTGMRYAGNSDRNPSLTNAAANVRVVTTDAAGRSVTLGVEYAGAAPGFPGVDQVNVVLPDEANMAQRLNITIQIAGVSSNTLSILVEPLTVAGATLSVSPEEDFSATGQASSFVGAQTAKVYTLRSSAPISQAYTARADVPWLSVSPAAGTISANGSAAVTVALAAEANSLAAETYTGTITFVGGQTTVTRRASLTVTPIGACLSIAGDWNVVESGTMTVTITALGETDKETDRISGQGRVSIAQDGCSIRYTPPAIAGLLTAQQAAEIQRTGTVSGAQVSVQGQLVVTATVPGLTVNQISENQVQGSGQVSGGILTLTSTGRFRASGTFSMEGQSGSFMLVLEVSTTTTFRRAGI